MHITTQTNLAFSLLVSTFLYSCNTLTDTPAQSSTAPPSSSIAQVNANRSAPVDQQLTPEDIKARHKLPAYIRGYIRSLAYGDSSYREQVQEYAYLADSPTILSQRYALSHPYLINLASQAVSYKWAAKHLLPTLDDVLEHADELASEDLVEHIRQSITLG
ncbi:MAG: hypothetical protein AAFV97_01140 [Bacteroidota bacterium]